jgi:hypothetical protein
MNEEEIALVIMVDNRQFQGATGDGYILLEVLVQGLAL